MRMLFQTQCPVIIPVVFLIACLTFISCNERSDSSPIGFNIKEPETRELGKSVNEISGLTYNSDDSSLLAI